MKNDNQVVWPSDKQARELEEASRRLVARLLKRRDYRRVVDAYNDLKEVELN